MARDVEPDIDALGKDFGIGKRASAADDPQKPATEADIEAQQHWSSYWDSKADATGTDSHDEHVESFDLADAVFEAVSNDDHGEYATSRQDAQDIAAWLRGNSGDDDSADESDDDPGDDDSEFDAYYDERGAHGDDAYVDDSDDTGATDDGSNESRNPHSEAADALREAEVEMSATDLDFGTGFDTGGDAAALRPVEIGSKIERPEADAEHVDGEAGESSFGPDAFTVADPVDTDLSDTGLQSVADAGVEVEQLETEPAPGLDDPDLDVFE